MKIAFLASQVTLPGSPTRRADFHEHDLQVACLSAPMSAKDLELIPIDWRDDMADWREFDAAIIGTTWDYWNHHEEFLAKLNGLVAQGVPVHNPPELVLWNSRKTYLKALGAKGVATLPTLWAEHPSADDLARAFDHLNTDDLIVKRQVGAGAQDQLRIKRGDVLTDYAFDAMIQPFIPTIQTEGEFSFIMIDGELSHALRKTAKAGDYRIQSLYGGVESRFSPSADDISMVKQVINALDEPPLYARVDVLRLEDGSLALMELELIEPYLYPEQADHLGEMMANALAKRLGM